MYHSRILGGAGPVVRQWQRREQISDATLQRHGAWQHFNVLRFELGFVRLQCKAKHYDEITIQGARTGKLYLRYLHCVLRLYFVLARHSDVLPSTLDFANFSASVTARKLNVATKI